MFTFTASSGMPNVSASVMRDDRSRAGADVLAAGDRFHGAVGMDLEQARRGMGRSAPRVQGHAEAAASRPFFAAPLPRGCHFAFQSISPAAIFISSA